MTNVGFPVYSMYPINADGSWRRDWWLFLQLLWERTGGSQGQSSSDLSADMPEDAGIEEMRFDLFRRTDGNDSGPPFIPYIPPQDVDSRVAALEALVSQLTTQIQALQQGSLL